MALLLPEQKRFSWHFIFSALLPHVRILEVCSCYYVQLFQLWSFAAYWWGFVKSSMYFWTIVLYLVDKNSQCFYLLISSMRLWSSKKNQKTNQLQENKWKYKHQKTQTNQKGSNVFDDVPFLEVCSKFCHQPEQCSCPVYMSASQSLRWLLCFLLVDKKC